MMEEILHDLNVNDSKTIVELLKGGYTLEQLHSKYVPNNPVKVIKEESSLTHHPSLRQRIRGAADYTR